MEKIGILLTNVGTPEAPTKRAVRKYLAEFLSDPRIIELPAIVWQPILRGYILRSRPACSAQLYQKIWTETGSPLLHFSKKILTGLQQKMGNDVHIALGMHYGHPSIHTALEELKEKNITALKVLPLFPQYSATTTASTFDRVTKTMRQWRKLPSLHFIEHYALHPAYIDAIVTSVKKTWEKIGRAQHLLFSFHSIPKRYAERGDPYPTLCDATVKKVAEQLQLSTQEYSVSFQSRLGRLPWLQPYTDQVLQQLPQQGVTNLQVICPGFSVDCLETLEEIAIRGKEQFLFAGGNTFHYIPALNDTEEHLTALIKLL